MPGAFPRPFRRSSLVTHAAPVAAAEPGAPKAGDAKDGPWLLAACLETAPAWEDAEVEAEVPGRGMKPVRQAVAAIAFVRARIIAPSTDAGGERLEVVECRAGGTPGADERTLVSGFWSAFEGWKPRLVSFNGRGHLLPTLRYASMRHGLTANWLHEAGDRWSGFGVRFSTAYHADMMDILSDHNASPYPALGDVARAIGLPLSLPEPGVGEARDRAVANAAAVFSVYLRWMLYTGKMTREGHDAALASLAQAQGAHQALAA